MGEKYKEYRAKWDKYPKEFIQEKVPLHLDLELTTRCNLKCPFCPRTIISQPIKDMDLDLAKRIIKEFASKGGCAIKFVYLGEPTLYPHLVEVVKYAKKCGIVDTRIATNGNTLTKKISKGLIEAGLDLIIFSIDSINPHIYESIRRKGRLGRVIKNLVVFKYLRDKTRKHTTIQVQAIPFKQNKEEIKSGAYYDLFEPLADIVWVSPWCIDYSKDMTMGATPKFNCPAPFRRLLVRWNGDIWLCCGYISETKFIGNYSEMSLEEVWNGEYVKKIRKYLNDGKAHLIEPCKSCEERYLNQ